MVVSIRSINLVKLGDYVKRSAEATKVYTRGSYDRASNRYSLIDTDDISREVWVKGSAVVYLGFEY